MADDEGTPKRGFSMGAGCAIGALALVGLCVVPRLIFGVVGAFGRPFMRPVITVPEDPSHAGLGIGGPRMPATAESIHAVPAADMKALDLRVASLAGATWTEVGAYCRVRMLYEPTASATPCSVEVTCGETPVYGGASETPSSFECAARVPPDGLHAGADHVPLSEDGSPLLIIEDDVVRVSDPGGPRDARTFELVLSRTAPPLEPVIDPATIVDPAAVQLVPPIWPVSSPP